MSKISTREIEENITQYGMARQAIMNGNFDVWQRGTSVALADITKTFLADRWNDYVNKDGGTLPTLTRSRQLLTSGDISNAFYFTRLATNGAGTTLGVNSLGRLQESIEFGTRNLCGNGKKITVSFWAKSDITNKRICPTIAQDYGTGGAPTSQEVIKGTPITLTSSWTKYTATFTTNTLVGKTFGTNNDDAIYFSIWYMWGTTAGNTYVQTGVTAETFVGAGNIDIAQVQLCSGDVALPFQPKSYGEELRACQRYCYGVTTSATNGVVGIYAPAISTTAGKAQIVLPTKMRIIPDLTATAADWQLSDGANPSTDVTVIALSTITEQNIAEINLTVASGLTQYRVYKLVSDGSTPRTLVLSAEL